MFRLVHIIVLVIVVASVTEARIKFKKLDIITDPNYLKIQTTMEERDDKPYLSIVTDILQDIDGEIIVSLFNRFLHQNISIDRLFTGPR